MDILTWLAVLLIVAVGLLVWARRNASPKPYEFPADALKPFDKSDK